jgi:hypothetical protein
MMAGRLRVLRFLIVAGFIGSTSGGCGGDSASTSSEGFGGGMSGSSTERGTMSGPTSSSTGFNVGGSNTGTSTSTNSGAGGEGGGTNLCVGMQCDADQHCAVVMNQPTCVNNTCAMLMCTATELCVTTPGGGATCQDNSCTGDVDCPSDEYCNGTICVSDVCTPGALTCMGADVHECTPDGGSDPVKVTCGSQSYFTSTCVDQGNGVAGCSCQDDWDCPANQACDVGTCTGTGKAPTCTIPPQPFTSALPATEIFWGGVNVANPDATGHPFPTSSQACTTPVVVNLDDDNGDGRIDELDFPEIIFMTYCNSDIANNGIVRAIHGGGPNKGKDMFAACGTTVWHEGDDIDMPCSCATATGNSTASLAVGDIDGDGVPEIVVPTENDGLVILSARGDQIAATANNQWSGYTNPTPAIANIDNKGFAEIVVGNQVFTLDHDVNGVLEFVDHFDGGAANPNGSNGQGPIACIANVTGDSQQEIIAGSTVYALQPLHGETKVADCPVGATDPYCKHQLTVVWDGQAVNTAMVLPNSLRDGFCAVADVLGVDETIAPSPSNPLDGKPEVILIADGHLLIFNGANGTLRRNISITTTRGGAPNVDDFDGDGFPEIGTAFGNNYQVIDLQDPTAACPAWTIPLSDAMSGLQGNPQRSPGGMCTADADCSPGAVCNTTAGTCVCLHNNWLRTTEDDSSSVTGSSVFDFNGDGAAEVVYNDECYFRVYSGLNGDVLYKIHSPSRTRVENPVVADVDNDGNAEIVFTSNNEVAFCSEGNDYPNGLTVLGDPTDTWVSARRIWNQHAYHITNVTEGGAIPQFETESWKPYNGRVYNTYRSNPRSYGVAPDLTVGGVQVTSPNRACGQLTNQVTITVEIDNIGDLRVGPGVGVTFYGEWSNPTLEEPLYANMMMLPLTATIQTSIEPGGAILLSVSYDATDNTRMTLPDSVRVVVDEANVARECNENNNELTQPVAAGAPLPDLTLSLGVASGCPSPVVPTTVTNIGSAPASNVLVRYYAGDPNAGGTPLHDELIPGPIAGLGGMVTINPSIPNFPQTGSVTLYGIVDPDNTIPECNDGNNKDAADNSLSCQPH